MPKYISLHPSIFVSDITYLISTILYIIGAFNTSLVNFSDGDAKIRVGIYVSCVRFGNTNIKKIITCTSDYPYLSFGSFSKTFINSTGDSPSKLTEMNNFMDFTHEFIVRAKKALAPRYPKNSTIPINLTFHYEPLPLEGLVYGKWRELFKGPYTSKSGISQKVVFQVTAAIMLAKLLVQFFNFIGVFVIIELFFLLIGDVIHLSGIVGVTRWIILDYQEITCSGCLTVGVGMLYLWISIVTAEISTILYLIRLFNGEVLLTFRWTKL